MAKHITALQRNILVLGALFAASLIALVLMLPLHAEAALLTQTLDVGDSNADVTSLQTYLAVDSSLYPSGLVTGYYGSLTEAAVQRFQTAQGIVTSGTPETTGFGRVGPQTLARINALMSGSGASGDSVPVLSSLAVQHTTTGATFTWTTNEPTTGQVYWDGVPIRADEATGPRQSPYVSGTLVADSVGISTAHSVSISNLQPNTTYYYLVRSVDSAGNMSMIWPASFYTGN